jgi:rod shape-determining protein MreC
VLILIVCVLCIALFALWRIDNPRIERVRMTIIDRFAPSMDWATWPVTTVARMARDFESYTRVYERNQELREELQRMKGWQEAAIQLEQQNARLRELNNVRLSPRLTYITGEILADSGSPFRQSGLVNIGTGDGVIEGAAAMDGLGLVGRVAGLANSTSRILFLTDASSRISVTIRPSGQRAIVTGDNTIAPALEFLDKAEGIEPGDRVVTSGIGGVFPPDLLVGQVVKGRDGVIRVKLSADYRRLRYIRILRPQTEETIEQSDELLGPRLPPFVQNLETN